MPFKKKSMAPRIASSVFTVGFLGHKLAQIEGNEAKSLSKREMCGYKNGLLDGAYVLGVLGEGYGRLQLSVFASLRSKHTLRIRSVRACVHLHARENAFCSNTSLVIHSNLDRQIDR